MYEYSGLATITTPAGTEVELDIELYQNSPGEWMGHASTTETAALAASFDSSEPCTITLANGNSASLWLTRLDPSGAVSFRGAGAPPAVDE